MATVNYSVPDSVKDAFNEAYAGENKSAVITALMREAVERTERKQRSREAISRILERRPKAPQRSPQTLATSRQKGRP